MTTRHIVDLTMDERATLAAVAGRDEVAKSKAMGLPITGMRGNKIVKTYPDGREEALKILNRPTGNSEDDG